MAIARAMIKLLMREGIKENFTGKVITAGRQDIYATANDLKNWAEDMNFPLRPDVDMEITTSEMFQKKGYITDKALFLSLGFDSVDSLDYSAYQNCTIVHDLNENIPEQYFEKYNMVFDGGTMEHVFNVPKVLENFCNLTKVGGRIIHASPSSNHVDHGLYMFSPTLFVDYYSANKWTIIDTLFWEYKPTSNTGLLGWRRWNIYSYSPGSLDTWIYGGYRGMFGIFSVTKKTCDSSTSAVVYQGCFRQSRSIVNIKDPITTEIKNVLDGKTFIQRVAYSKEYISPRLRDIIRPLYYRLATYLPLRFHLKLVARY